MIKALLLWLKRFPTFIRLYDKYVYSYRIKRKYTTLLKHYQTRSPFKSVSELLTDKGFSTAWADRFTRRKPRIFYIGNDEAQDNSGFLQELKLLADVRYYQKTDGGYGAHTEGLFGAEVVCEGISRRLADYEQSFRHEKWSPDILLMQGWGCQYKLEDLARFKRVFDLKIINISMDDRHTYWLEPKTAGTFGLVPVLDLALTAAPECVDWYLKEGIPSLFFPEASSGTFYFPMGLDKPYDVGFIGGKYGVREELVNYLVENGINVVTFGKGWANGHLPLADVNRFFNQCKMVLGVGTIRSCTDFYALKLRDFDVPMSGSLYITHNNPDLRELFLADEEMIFYDNKVELLQKVKYYLSNPVRIREIAARGCERAARDHSYRKRFLDLFHFIGIPEPHQGKLSG